MSSGCGDVLSLNDLQVAKKHQTFEAEVITGLSGGQAGGGSIDFATNAVTGQVQKTLPAVLRDAGINLAPFDFNTGGTLGVNDAGKAVLWPAPAGDGNYYIWRGTLPKVIPASSTPSSTGGMSNTAWTPISSGNAFDLVAYDGTRYTNKGNFTAGVTVAKSTDVVMQVSTGWYYRYLGAFPHVIGPSEAPDSNWQALGMITGYPINHILNWKNGSTSAEQALTAAFNTGLEVNIEGATLTTSTDYTCPAGAKGLYGRGTIMLGNNFHVTTSTDPVFTQFTVSASQGHSEVYLDGVNRVGQFVQIDNGYTFCIDDAENPVTPADSVDAIALTINRNNYKSQFIQVTEIIGHTASNKAILAQPLVVNQESGRAKFGFRTGNLTQFRIHSGVTMKSTDTTAMRRIMLLAQIKPEVIDCTFENCHIEMRYFCYSGRVEDCRVSGNTFQSMISFATSSSVCSIKNNKINTLGIGDADIGIYRQVCYANVTGNIVTSPFINTTYASAHWSITFHSMVYQSLMANNTVSSRSGVCAQYFCDDVIIDGNTINCFEFASVYNQGVTYSNNEFNIVSDSVILGNRRFTSKGNRWKMRSGSTTNCVSISSGARPFGFAGFKVINSGFHDFTDDDFETIGRNKFINPKTLLANPNTAPANAVLPTNNAHMANQTSGITIYDSRVAALRVNGCRFNELNYGINLYKNDTTKSSTAIEISDNSFTTDVGICLRGISAQSLLSGFVKNCNFTGSIGVVNANTLGIPVLSCAFLSNNMSAILVASNLTAFMGVTMSTDCSVAGVVLTGFKWYDFNGYAASYASTPTYALASSLPGGYWWYAPAENLGQAASIPYEYSKGGTTGGNVLLRKALTIVQLV